MNEELTYTYPAAEGIPSYTPVAVIAGQAYKLDATKIAHIHAYAGISLNGVSKGQPVKVQFEGTVSFTGWQFTSSTPYYIGLNHSIVVPPLPPGVVFRKQIGYAIDKNRLMITKDVMPVKTI